MLHGLFAKRHTKRRGGKRAKERGEQEQKRRINGGKKENGREGKKEGSGARVWEARVKRGSCNRGEEREGED